MAQKWGEAEDVVQGGGSGMVYKNEVKTEGEESMGKEQGVIFRKEIRIGDRWASGTLCRHDTLHLFKNEGSYNVAGIKECDHFSS